MFRRVEEMSGERCGAGDDQSSISMHPLRTPARRTLVTRIQMVVKIPLNAL